MVKIPSPLPKTYTSFDCSLHQLLEEDRIADYPLLCAEFTSRFSLLSSKCIKTKEILLSRSQKVISDCIASIQMLEKEKLILVAARHMEAIQMRIPAIQQHIGSEITLQPAYIANNVAKVEEKINDLMESLQVSSCFLILIPICQK